MGCTNGPSLDPQAHFVSGQYGWHVEAVELMPSLRPRLAADGDCAASHHQLQHRRSARGGRERRGSDGRRPTRQASLPWEGRERKGSTVARRREVVRAATTALGGEAASSARWRATAGVAGSSARPRPRVRPARAAGDAGQDGGDGGCWVRAEQARIGQSGGRRGGASHELAEGESE